MPTPASRSVEPRNRSNRDWREYITTQRVIVIAFAVIEAVILGWAIGYVILRDVAQ